MILATFVAGMLENNNYVLIDELSNEAVLIDCTEYLPEIKEYLDSKHAKLKYVLITHGHFDHILGLAELHKNFPETEILAPKLDQELIETVSAFVDRFVGGMGHVEPPPISRYIDEDDEIYIGKSEIRVISTPGHTEGGVCYYVDDKLFSGDTIFLGSVGRTDLPGGSFDQLHSSVKNVLEMLPNDVEIYPGHGEQTSVKYEKECNPIL